MTRAVSLVVNGRPYTAETEDRTPLCDVLRHRLRLTGTHVGCEQGVCGACTVLVDGEPVRSCLMLAVQADGCRIETVEGLATEGALAPMQQALMAEHGLQCGFCTPGVLMSLAYAERARLTAEETVSEVLAGHLCRCTGYVGIRRAIERHWKTEEAAG
ncbi:2Fe-2S iron-sulfur cluster-binding protein [Kitasatospora sp. GP82]|uniref:(2Fe-2S)-binding protein n=1 Tax=Kitasatospora sp. GP82 TaxID=3035089 RepID=UPI0024731844|nr:2Fe-2S iron-sulfur cluster-binding protein [Kitasatospora sp. GP82]MDH6128350.1 aerobic-type carbon monoxide dehydrogenase small subunit (CoxS/CutS family) [Kitasatospora sp. GP82]